MQIILTISCIAVGVLMVYSANCHLMICRLKGCHAMCSKENQTLLRRATSEPV